MVDDTERGADDTILPYRIRRPNLPHAGPPARARPVATRIRLGTRLGAGLGTGFAPWMYLVPVSLVLAGALAYAVLQGRPPQAVPQLAAPQPPALTAAVSGPASGPTYGPLPPPAVPAFPAAYLAFAREADILASQSTSLSMFRLAENPAILVLEFPSLREQARMLNRVAVLIETRFQPRDRVLDDDALDRAIRATGAEPDTFYDGHDYRAADLMRFFALAERDGIRLNQDELRLRELVRAAGWMDAGAVGALITLPTLGAGIDPAARRSILRHEISHGEFFTDPDYARFTQSFWQTELSDIERTAFRRFLAGQEYDPADETLMMNEMQAYLVHTNDRRFFGPEMVALSPERVDTLRRRFIGGMPAGWFRDLTLREPHN